MTAPVVFPCEPVGLATLALGSSVVRISGLGHVCLPPVGGCSGDRLFFDAVWRLGQGPLVHAEMPLFSLRAVSLVGHAWLQRLSAAVSLYQEQHGTWFDAGPHEGWYAHRVRPAAPVIV